MHRHAHAALLLPLALLACTGSSPPAAGSGTAPVAAPPSAPMATASPAMPKGNEPPTNAAPDVCTGAPPDALWVAFTIEPSPTGGVPVQQRVFCSGRAEMLVTSTVRGAKRPPEWLHFADLNDAERQRLRGVLAALRVDTLPDDIGVPAGAECGQVDPSSGSFEIRTADGQRRLRVAVWACGPDAQRISTTSIRLQEITSAAQRRGMTAGP